MTQYRRRKCGEESASDERPYRVRGRANQEHHDHSGYLADQPNLDESLLIEVSVRNGHSGGLKTGDYGRKRTDRDNDRQYRRRINGIAGKQSATIGEVQCDAYEDGKRPQAESADDLNGPYRIEENGVVAAPALHDVLVQPMSESRARIIVTRMAMVMTPNISGTSRRVMTKLLHSRMTCVPTDPARVHIPAWKTRCFSVRGARSVIERKLKVSGELKVVSGR
jgi:hypothetical protein